MERIEPAFVGAFIGMTLMMLAQIQCGGENGGPCGCWVRPTLVLVAAAIGWFGGMAWRVALPLLAAFVGWKMSMLAST